MFVEESKKEVKNGCFLRLHEGWLSLSLKERTMTGRGGREEKNGREAVASIKGKKSSSAIYGDLTGWRKPFQHSLYGYLHN